MCVLVDTLRLGDLGSNQDAVSEHELRSDIPEASLIWELIPHSAHQRLSSVSCPLDSTVNVVDKIIAPINCIANSFSNPACLHPWLSVMKWEWQVNILRVSPKERIPTSDLIEHDEKIVSGGTIETWNI